MPNEWIRLLENEKNKKKIILFQKKYCLNYMNHDIIKSVVTIEVNILKRNISLVRAISSVGRASDF